MGFIDEIKSAFDLEPFAKEPCYKAVIFGDSEYDISLEVDMDKQGINEFLNELTKVVSFKDISVEELPMDMIISRIYTE